MRVKVASRDDFGTSKELARSRTRLKSLGVCGAMLELKRDGVASCSNRQSMAASWKPCMGHVDVEGG